MLLGLPDTEALWAGLPAGLPLASSHCVFAAFLEVSGTLAHWVATPSGSLSHAPQVAS